MTPKIESAAIFGCLYTVCLAFLKEIAGSLGDVATPLKLSCACLAAVISFGLLIPVGLSLFLKAMSKFMATRQATGMHESFFKEFTPDSPFSEAAEDIPTAIYVVIGVWIGVMTMMKLLIDQ